MTETLVNAPPPAFGEAIAMDPRPGATSGLLLGALSTLVLSL